MILEDWVPTGFSLFTYVPVASLPSWSAILTGQQPKFPRKNQYLRIHSKNFLLFLQNFLFSSFLLNFNFFFMILAKRHQTKVMFENPFFVHLNIICLVQGVGNPWRKIPNSNKGTFSGLSNTISNAKLHSSDLVSPCVFLGKINENVIV